MGLRTQISNDFEAIYSNTEEFASPITYKKANGSVVNLTGVVEAPIFGDTELLDGTSNDSTVVYLFLDFEPSKDDIVEISGKDYRIDSFSLTLAGYQIKLADRRSVYHHTQGRFR